MALLASAIVPEIDTEEATENQRRLYDNFTILKDVLKNGVTGTYVIAGTTYRYDRGILVEVT